MTDLIIQPRHGSIFGKPAPRLGTPLPLHLVHFKACHSQMKRNLRLVCRLAQGCVISLHVDAYVWIFLDAAL